MVEIVTYFDTSRGFYANYPPSYRGSTPRTDGTACPLAWFRREDQNDGRDHPLPVLRGRPRRARLALPRVRFYGRAAPQDALGDARADDLRGSAHHDGPGCERLAHVEPARPRWAGERRCVCVFGRCGRALRACEGGGCGYCASTQGRGVRPHLHGARPRRASLVLHSAPRVRAEIVQYGGRDRPREKKAPRGARR